MDLRNCNLTVFGVALVMSSNIISLIRRQFACLFNFGELGVKKLLPFDNTLLGENILGLCSGKGVRDHLWRRVSKSMFLWGGWYSNEVCSSYKTSLLEHIRVGWENFSKFIRFDVGEWYSILFWCDLWCGDTLLKETFPELFQIAQNKICNGVILYKLVE